MGHNRYTTNTANVRNQQYHFESAASDKTDLFFGSESPRVQQFLLHQKLKEEIERNSTKQLRYVDSELYFRHSPSNNNRQRSRNPTIASQKEVQSATLNIGAEATKHKHIDGQIKPLPTPGGSSTGTSSTLKNNGLGPNTLEAAFCRLDELHQRQSKSNRECQVCLIKEVGRDLMNINRIVQERNEQIAKLKAKCLRSYFERQMMD